MSVTRLAVKTETLKKTKMQPAWVLISLPLESGQLESRYFYLGTSNGISVAQASKERVWGAAPRFF